MAEGVVIQKLPPAKRPVPYHLYVLRLIMGMCTCYALFSTCGNDVVKDLYVKIAVLLIYVADTVLYYRLTTCSLYDDVSKMAMYFGSRIGCSIVVLVLLGSLGFDCDVRFTSLILAYVLTILADALLLFDSNQRKRDANQSEAGNNLNHREYDPINILPPPLLYTFIVLRFAMTALYFRMVVFSPQPEMDPAHFPMRVFWGLLFLADSCYFVYRVNYASTHSQNANELSIYSERLQVSVLERFFLVFGTNLYFTLVPNGAFLGNALSVFCWMLIVDFQLLKHKVASIAERLRQKND